MTMMSAKQVIAGLRSKNKDLKTTIENAQEWLTRIRAASTRKSKSLDASFKELAEILGVEE